MSLEKYRKLIIAVALTSVAVLSAYLYTPNQPGDGPLPDFTQLDPQARKDAFFGYLLPIIEHHNAEIRRTRDWVLEMIDADDMNWFDARRWQRLADTYRIPDDVSEDKVAISLLRRINEVPPSLVLAQAAKESSWGRSRFAREGNALFGEWCFDEGCGIIPAGRKSGTNHEVRSFESGSASVESYMLNLNSHESYSELRSERERLSRQGFPVRGSALAQFMTFYSERREAYVDEIVALIAYNKLEPPTSGD